MKILEKMDAGEAGCYAVISCIHGGVVFFYMGNIILYIGCIYIYYI